jgi:nicotinamidase-related amidase
MPATVLDPKTALVVIDLQKGISAIPLAQPFAAVVSRTVRLAEAFRAAKLPVVLVNVAFSADGGDVPRTRTESPFRGAMGPDFSELVPELGAQTGDLRVTKRQPNAFYGTDLDLQLRRRGVTGVVMTGVATSAGVEATARAAQERSYNVTFASDAMTDREADVHEMFVTRLFPRMGEVDTTDAILALLGKR